MELMTDRVIFYYIFFASIIILLTMLWGLTKYKKLTNFQKNNRNKKSIVFDATNNNIKKRKEYIDFACNNNYKIRCVHMNTSMEESYKRNKQRPEDKQVPKIAFNVYKKYFEEPNEEEGFVLLSL